MIAVDTSVWIDYLHGRPKPRVLLLQQMIHQNPETVAMVDITFPEITQGLRDNRVAFVERHLADFRVLHIEWKHDFRAAAGLYRAARKSGFSPRGTIDCLIAAVCIRENVPLLHHDVDFDRLAAISELSVIG